MFAYTLTARQTALKIHLETSRVRPAEPNVTALIPQHAKNKLQTYGVAAATDHGPNTQHKVQKTTALICS
eukprot:855046-Pelagomonas_calceolata.AAC.2